ncbi:hypothetical protein FG386_000335 [Cryptosporidium ryanae]|uniref:uncharacterized protein n=1 Tax=Cryptosporidium ryanae TaxID=515981 RepID=UPI00351A19E4|nr:hypothetical protein FG386_000335 [Cryptosporidium ryanae]
MEMHRYSTGLSNSEFQSLEINKSVRDHNFSLLSPTLTCEEKAITIVKRLYYSEFSKYLYFAISLLNLLVLCIGIFKHQSGGTFCILLETVITLTLVFEVLIKLFLMRERFFNSLNNLFDFVVALTCLMLLLLNGDIYRLFIDNDIKHLENNQIVTDIFEQILTSSRFFLQLLRVLTIARMKGKTEVCLNNEKNTCSFCLYPHLFLNINDIKLEK